MKNKILKYGTAAILWLVYVFPVMAFPGDPESGENDDEVPIDQWVIALILAGIILGIHYIGLRKKARTSGG